MYRNSLCSYILADVEPSRRPRAGLWPSGWQSSHYKAVPAKLGGNMPSWRGSSGQKKLWMGGIPLEPAATIPRRGAGAGCYSWRSQGLRIPLPAWYAENPARELSEATPPSCRVSPTFSAENLSFLCIGPDTFLQSKWWKVCMDLRGIIYADNWYTDL